MFLSTYDINGIVSPHVETVVFLSRKTPDDTIEVDLDLDELDITSAESKANPPGNQRLCAERIWIKGFNVI